MSSMVVGGYRNANVANLRKGYQEQSIVITKIPNHKDGHYVRPNKVVLNYPDFKKDDDLNLHVTVFNFVVKANAENSKEYIINVFSYMLKDTPLDWFHNYMLKFLNCTFSKLTQAFCKCHRNIQNDEQMYMELKNMKQEETKRVEVYYEWIQKLAHGLQVLTKIVF
jgi:hypothetical protein